MSHKRLHKFSWPGTSSRVSGGFRVIRLTHQSKQNDRKAASEINIKKQLSVETVPTNENLERGKGTSL